MRALMCRGVQRTGIGMEGGEGEVLWRVGDGRADKGPVVWVRRRRKRVKGQAGRESGTLRSASEMAASHR